ncbi:MAG: hypothetical protein L3J74_15835 [Bacteroidales bacterium]|nr:hypothetical protein [Bacteroidales bacterium]
MQNALRFLAAGIVADSPQKPKGLQNTLKKSGGHRATFLAMFCRFGFEDYERKARSRPTVNLSIKSFRCK